MCGMRNACSPSHEVTHDRSPAAGEPAAALTRHTEFYEAVRALRTSLQFLGVDLAVMIRVAEGQRLPGHLGRDQGRALGRRGSAHATAQQ